MKGFLLLSLAMTVLQFSAGQNNSQRLQIDVLFKPANCQRTVQKGQTVSVNYIGTLTDGSKFDSSYDRNEPITVQIGVGKVIKGWDQGIVGMCIGEQRRLVIPSSLGYGEKVKKNLISELFQMLCFSFRELGMD